ncbi:alpha/beta hydrolase [Paraflavitalea sp. CAU 1676]|uniref:alpha/beta fold hydrolase n=1 Tax=Paraflavitalea sp. CAU 1676 TaxID=3032598 RepID=UPI0023DC1639|nr:alpha/beta hydrolase [Paraflavitalea sp. CAU 1676]MDF2192235.1 alpha/beta hydrolase [Paraflavitalea sp. CAU 1676]
MAATEKFIDIDGHALFYRVTGNGTPVILLHGFAEDNTIWQHQTAALESQYQLIIPDLPGSGRSGATADMSMEGLAQSVKEILTAELPEEQQVIMIGHSMGGYVTLAFAEMYPEKLKAIGLFHSTAYADSEEKKTTRQKGIEFMLQHGGALFIQQTTPNMFAPAFKKDQPAVVQEIVDRYSNFSTESLVQYYKSMMARPDRTDVLRKSTNPVLFIAGEYDTAIPKEHTMQQSYLPSLSYIHLLKESGHMGMLEEPEKSNQLLIGFLANA